MASPEYYCEECGYEGPVDEVQAIDGILYLCPECGAELDLMEGEFLNDEDEDDEE